MKGEKNSNRLLDSENFPFVYINIAWSRYDIISTLNRNIFSTLIREFKPNKGHRSIQKETTITENSFQQFTS